MAQVSIATAAGHGSAHHAEARVAQLFYVLLRDRLPEARPAGTGLELGIGVEQRRITADAAIQTGLVVVPVLAGEGHLGAVMTGDLESVGRKLLAPLGL